MADIIQFATGEEVGSALASANQQVSGMSAAEAWAALKLRPSSKMGVGDYVSQGGNNVVNFPTQDASGAFNSYVDGGGGVSSSGAAAAGSSSSFTLSSFLKAGAAKVGAVLSISLPQAFAAIAPLLGVAVGVGLYELSPNFWTKVSQTLLPFCWEGTENLPGVVGEDGQVYLDSAAIEAMKQLFDELEIGSEIDVHEGDVVIKGSTLKGPLYRKAVKIQKISGKSINNKYYPDRDIIVPYIGTGVVHNRPVVGYLFNKGVPDGETIDGVEVVESNGNIWVALLPDSVPSRQWGTWWLYNDGDNYTATTSNTAGGVYFNWNDKSAYGVSVYTPEWAKGIVNSCPNAGVAAGQYQLMWWALYGDATPTAHYIPGSSKYEGNIPVDYTDGAIDVVTDKSGATKPYYPVHIPLGDPGVTTPPEVNPNPQSPNEFPALTPLIRPEVSPNQYPSSVPVPAPDKRTNPIPSPAKDPAPSYDPNNNPSVKPEPVPVPDTAPSYPEATPEDSPTSTGDSPPTIFPIPDVSFPTVIPATGSGLVHVYNPTPDEMIAFGHWLWVTYADASITKLWNNPFDGVISAHELYATPQTDGKDSIRSGFLVCPTSANLVRIRYTTIDCGSIVIPEFYQNYLDYSPYTKAHVYLPFIGIVELDPDDIVGHAVNVKYHVDSYNGSCIAQITVARTDYSNTVYQFSGNCAVELPLAGGSQASIKAGMIMAAASGITSVVGGIASALTGNVGGAVGSLVSGAGSAAGHLVSQKSSVQHSGSFGASFGAMGIKKPYIIVRRPIQKEVTNYNLEYGFPAHKQVTIGSCTGYLRVLEVHVKSPTATDEEKRAIEVALKNGIFVT